MAVSFPETAQANDRFARDNRARILTPDAPGLGAICAALDAGATITAVPGLETTAGHGQWLLTRSAGSTGAPKTIIRRPASWRASFEVNRDRFGITEADTYAVPGGFAHSLALYATLEALHLGAGLAVYAGMQTRAMARAFATHRPTVLYATPVQVGLLLRAGADLASLRLVLIGGGRLLPALRAALSKAAPDASISEFYGTSEASFIAISDAETPPGSVGRAYPGVSIRLDQAGEVWVSSPYLCNGYQEPEHTLRQHGDHLGTGEVGRLDQDGYLYLEGRRDRMVTVNDRNVFPEAVEAALTAVLGPVPVAVIPVEDAARGHSLVAFVESDRALAEAELRAACKAAIGSHAIPRRFVQLDRLPLLAAGKADLEALRRLAEEP